jgi:tetratricopeptide (TPR) repeat protein
LICETLAALCRDERKFGDSEKYYRATLSACETLFDEKHDSIFENAGNLGNVLILRGNIKEAEKYCRQAWTGFSETLGPQDPNTQQAAFNLSVVLTTIGQFEEAESLCESVAKERAKTLGRSHALTLNSLSAYAGILRHRKKFQEAEQVYSFLLQVKERQFGPESDEVHNCLVSLALCKKERGEHGLANKLYERVASASGKHLNAPVDEASLQAAEDAAHALLALGRLDEAESICRKVGKVYKQVYGDEDMRTIRCMNDMAHIYAAQNNFMKAERILRFVVSSWSDILGVNHPNVIDAKINLARQLTLGDNDLATLTTMVGISSGVYLDSLELLILFDVSRTMSQ